MSNVDALIAVLIMLAVLGGATLVAYTGVLIEKNTNIPMWIIIALFASVFTFSFAKLWG